ncbi:membrane protein [Angustibacter speluncae]
MVRTAARLLLGAFLATAGVLHLVRPDEFLAQVPAWFPVDEGFTVLASGVVEIVLGLAVVAAPRRHRRTVGVVVALFLVAVFPGNVAQYLEGVDAFGLDTDRARLVRLFFQPLLVLWALWACEVLRRRRPDGGVGAPDAS